MTEHSADNDLRAGGEDAPLWPRLIAFLALAGGFLWWVLMGTVEARVWTDGRLSFDDRPIRQMWTDQARNLPVLPGTGVIHFFFWVSLAVVVLGTVLGLWMFLGAPDADQTEHLPALSPDDND